MKKINCIFLCALISFTVSCGSNLTDNGSSELESRSDINPDESSTEVYDASGALQALCAPLKESSINLDSQLELYFKNGIYIPDQIYLRLKKIPVGVSLGSQYINFFKQYEPDNGGVMTEPSPVEFVFIHKGTRSELGAEVPINSLSKGTIEELIANNELENFGYTTENFLLYFDIVLKGLDLKYESLLLALYESGGATTATASKAALLPAYPADPNIFEKADNTSYMLNLHPMIDRKNGGLSEQMFKNEIESACLAPY